MKAQKSGIGFGAVSGLPNDGMKRDLHPIGQAPLDGNQRSVLPELAQHHGSVTMKTESVKPFGALRLTTSLFMAAALWLLSSFAANAAQLSIEFRNSSDGSVITVGDYRWTVEEDATKASVPGRPANTSNYSFSFHTSYMPVLAAGRVGTQTLGVTADPDVARLYSQLLPEVCPPASPGACLDPAKRYYLSIAADGYQMGGAPVVFGAGGSATAIVYLNAYKLPTAQVSIFAFHDNSPINGAPDLPQEPGLAGFHVHLLEAGGTYGQSGGEVTQDAFGNPLGTTYDANGDLVRKGDGIILTDADGVATIKNLFPAKYTVVIVPPAGSDWVQTSTIEGGKGQDAWVKNNEPSFFQEFGPPGHHVFIGFVRPGCVQGPAGNNVRCNGLPSNGAGRNVTGRVIDTHHSRPPVYTFFRAAPVANCWVGLNDPATQQAIYATACKKDSTFTIPNVPDGIYEVVIWDEPLDVIIGATTITINGAASASLGDLPVTSWFGRYQGRVFQDIDGTGLPFAVADIQAKYIKVDPVTGSESLVDCTPGSADSSNVALCLKAGDLKPPFGEGIASNIRFRDGSIYQSTTTKKDGTFAFTEVFPFFNWMVAEIDYARFKASGATMVVDDGGEVSPAANQGKLWKAEKGSFGSNDPAITYDPWTRLNPQLQETCTEAQVLANRGGTLTGPIVDASKCFAVGPKYYRTENCAEGDGQCAILLEGMQTFLGQTNHIEWGKQPYNGTVNNDGRIGENGGIAGIVHYAITRAEDDPRFAAAENWEPGIPRVQVNLFLDCDGDGKPDQPLNNGTGQCAAGGLSLADNYSYDQPDVDNYPFCWRDPEFVTNNPGLCLNGQTKGPEDIKLSRSGDAATFSYGDVFRWGAPNQSATAQSEIGLGKTDAWDDSIPTECAGAKYTVPSTGEQLDCFDGLRNFNQLRPAVFDGGYAFGRVAGQPELPMFIGAAGKGTYIVEAVAPPGYLHQGNGDKNVVFGDELQASTAALPFECVGMELDVPQYLTLFPGESNPNYDAGQRKWRKCDMKAVPLLPGANPAPDFYMFTEAPVAGHGVGFILDDTAAEFNRFAPTFGEKYSPPHLPVSIQDWTGREISRVYSDQFGSYNFLVPSSFTINPPFPSGVMPSMMVACMNHPGPIDKDPVTGVAYAQPQIDPYFNRAYTQFCYTLQYLAGKTTYLDTPVLPIAAFAPVTTNPLDCECADGTPAIYSATNGDNGPWVPAAGGTLTIVSSGSVPVVNPAYDPAITDPADPRSQKTILRDYGFGPSGTVTLDGATLTTGPWSNGVITATIPPGPLLAVSSGQLIIKRGDNGKESVVGLTVHRGGLPPKKVNLAGTNGAYRTIQEAIDAVTAGDQLLNNNLITIAPGTYNEYVIMDKRVRLQGWGAGAVTINAAKSSAGGLAAWRTRINAKATATPPTFDLLPGQELGIDAANNEPLLFGAEEGPGILVVGKQGVLGGIGPFAECLYGNTAALRIDGLTITGADAGGGILASGYACGLEVANNRIVSNYGTHGGGVRVGHTTLIDGIDFVDAINRNTNIHHNWITQNGASELGGGGGITLGTGSSSYNVHENYVCGNFSMADGGGLSHLGLSAGTSQIARNKFIFNQTFNQSADPMGAGLSIAAQIPLAGGTAVGAGDVVVDANLIQGNQAGAGAGGGVSIARTVSGNNANNTDDIVLTNNMIVNNVAAYSGGGVALTANGSGVRLVNNTVASNVSTATNRQSFGPGGPVKDANGNVQPSSPQIAGVAVLGGSNPTLLNNIVWANRQFIYLISGTTTGLFNPGTTNINSPNPNAAYSDLGRLSGSGLAPRYSVFTDTTANRTAFGTSLTGCTNAAPTSGTGVLCNRYEAAGSTTLFALANNFQSIIDPTQPVVLPETTVALRSAITFDESGNFINVIFSPLTLWVTTPGPTFGALRADYHLGAGAAVAINNGRARATSGGNNVAIGANYVPTQDIDRDSRPQAVDIGADEYAAPPLQTHLGALTGSSIRAALTWTATVNLTVHDAGHAAVSGALVSGSWSTGVGGSSSCTTSASGQCSVSRSFLNATTPVTFTVNSVTQTGTVYTPGSNDVGTSVTVNR